MKANNVHFLLFKMVGTGTVRWAGKGVYTLPEPR
jgi:hypothetical protein